MATNSISTLAVKITTDTSGLTRGFADARVRTQTFANSLNFAQPRLRAVAAGAFEMSGAVGRLGRTLGGVIGVAGPYGAAAGAVIAANAAIIAGMVKLAEAADRARDARLLVDREWAKAFDAIHGTNFERLNAGMKTNAELWDELKGKVSSFAELSGLSLKPMEEGLASLGDAFNRLVFGDEAVDSLNRLNDLAKTRAEQTKELQEQAAQRAKEIEHGIASMQQEMDASVSRLASRGQSLKESLRTPDEIFKDTLAELRQLADVGYITGETLSRGIGKAAEDFRKATLDVRRLREEMKTVPALEQGTAGFRTAVLSHQLSGAPSAEGMRLERQQVDLQKRIATAVEAAAFKSPVVFKKGSL